MTKFEFLVDNCKGAADTIKIIDDKFKANKEVQKMLWREIKHIDKIGGMDLYSCECLFPFPDLVMMSWYMVAINIVISIFFFRWWVFIPSIVLIWVAYTLRYLQTAHYYFFMLKKGMIKNGYKGKIWRV